MRVFADTFFYLAFLNPDDDAHGMAVRWYGNPEVREVITTSWILVEVADAMHMPRNRLLAFRFIRSLHRAPGTRVISTSEFLLERGLDLYADRNDKAWSLTDCISFVAMADERLTDALTGDHHFTQAGFRALMRP